MWILLLCMVCLAVMLLPMELVPATDGYQLSARPAKYSISGRIVMATVQTGEQRLFRFFNDVEGMLEVASGSSLVEAKGKVNIRLNIGRDNVDVEQHAKRGLLHHVISTGATPVASINVENLIGFRDKNIAVGNVTKGRLIGSIRALGFIDDFDVPVKIMRDDVLTYVVEPLEGLEYSIEKLGFSEEVATLMKTDPEMLEDLLRLYFKLILQPVE